MHESAGSWNQNALNLTYECNPLSRPLPFVSFGHETSVSLETLR